MNRYAVRIGSVLALALSALLCTATAGAADNTYVYNGKRIVFQTLLDRSAGPAVSADDPGLHALVSAKGAALSWDSENQYVLITFPGPTVISFAIGDPHYLAGSVTETAAFAPFMHDGHPYVPLNDVLRALKLPPFSASSSSAATAAPSPLPSSLPPSAAPAPAGTPAASPQPVQMTGVDVQTQPGSVTIRISLTGDGAFDWHRLRPPDNRWWIDIHGARLAVPPSDQSAADPVTSVRTRQQGDGVRVALSLSGFDQVDVVPNDGGITITVTSNTLADAPRSGTGTFGTNATAQASPVASPVVSPTRYVPTNPNLIAIDPGHGGSDPGAGRAGAQEKALTLDMARRVRDILVARGWQVIMTRDTDRDVYAPNDSARDELQARDDVANSRGARLMISIHVNSYVNSGPHGVTTFYYKAGDFALAQAVNRRVVSELGMKNNGVVKDKLYVINHANMPAALVETAFISNPDDLALLQSGSWRQKMAQAIADGIVDYTESN